MLPLDDQAKRNEWLVRIAVSPFKHMVYVGKDTSVKDVERWLRDALKNLDDESC